MHVKIWKVTHLKNFTNFQCLLDLGREFSYDGYFTEIPPKLEKTGGIYCTYTNPHKLV